MNEPTRFETGSDVRNTISISKIVYFVGLCCIIVSQCKKHTKICYQWACAMSLICALYFLSVASTMIVMVFIRSRLIRNDVTLEQGTAEKIVTGEGNEVLKL